MRSFKSIFFVSIVIVLCCIAATASAAPLRYAKGDPIDDFTFTTYDGQQITLSDVLKEKDAVLINIWATWCGPCRNEFPYLEEAYQQYKDKVEVIALSCESTDTNTVLASFANEYGLTFKIGQDPVGFLSAFGIGSIPTSFIVDRFGTICFVEAGSQPDVNSFIRLFDAFVGDDYSTSILLDGIPPMKPNVERAAEADLAAALESPAVNPTDAYTWPMIVTEKDDRRVLASSNAGQDSTSSSVTAQVSAQADDAIVVTFKTSSEAIWDMLSISVNDRVIKSFGGEHDWMTYAIPVADAGDYTITISYTKNVRAQVGEDTIWVDSVVVATGEEAAAALKANPVYPIAQASTLAITAPGAREILISDPQGILAANFGDAKYYIVNSDTAAFAATLSKDADPECAFFFCNYDGKITPVLSDVAEGHYIVSGGVDSAAKTGYTYTGMYLYPDHSGIGAQCIVYFKDEENASSFVTDNRLGTWDYAQDATLSDEVSSERDLVAAMPDYTLKCVDQYGNPVAGVMLQVCDDETCQVFFSDANGTCQFTAAAYAWEVHVLKSPEGYTDDHHTVVLAPVEGGEVLFTLTKN